jgi:hypothetical protein
MTSMPAVIAAAGLAAVASHAGCGSSQEAGLKTVVADGVAELSRPEAYDRRRRTLLARIARVRAVHVSRAGEPSRRLALRGFTAMLYGIESRIAFVTNDSGNVAAATRDARRGDRWLRAGAALLRAAGRELDLRVGTLLGY